MQGNIQKVAEPEVVSARMRNKQKRRDRILLATATIVCEDGVDAVRLAAVAAIAGVTVPTIHNLFGKKQDVFEHLIGQAADWMVEFFDVRYEAGTFEEFENIVHDLFKRIQENELQFKAGYMIGDRLGYFGQQDRPSQRAGKALVKQFEKFVALGDVHGNLSLMALAEFVSNNYRILRSDWVKGELTTAEFKQQFLWSLYVILLSDASPSLRKRLMKQLAKLENS